MSKGGHAMSKGGHAMSKGGHDYKVILRYNQHQCLILFVTSSIFLLFLISLYQS